MDLKTPLYDRHVAAGAKLMPFAGYIMPVQYSGILAEHAAVRSAAGLFDVSHMGELLFTGTDARANVQNLITRNITSLEAGCIAYTPMCNEFGGVVDDVLVYKRGEEDYLLVVNASNRWKDLAWAEENLFGDAKVTDVSSKIAQLALQGPAAQRIAEKLCAQLPEKYYTFIENAVFANAPALVSRTGYTGEDGFEIYCKREDAKAVWDAVMEAGAPEGLLRAGLGARDTLRLEAAMPLYGHEMDDDILPFEAGIGFFVDLDGPDFIGRDALIEKKAEARRRIGLVVTDKGIAREECAVWKDGFEVGVVTSGTYSPTLGVSVAMARVSGEAPPEGTEYEIEVRGRMLKAKTVKLPFYKRG